MFPAHIGFDGKPILTLVVKLPDTDEHVYFEGLLPDDFNFGSFTRNAVRASTEENASISRKRVETLLKSEDSMFADIAVPQSEIIEQELVQNADSWRNRFVEKNGEELPSYDADVYFSNVETVIQPAAASTGVPLTVFQKRGKWHSVNNPSNQALGYYAETAAFAGQSDHNLVKIISWEYLYNKPGPIIVQKDGKGENGYTETKLQVIDYGHYLFNTKTNTIYSWSQQKDFRIKGAALAMGLQADSEILTKAIPSSKVKKNAWDINWKYWIGLVNKTLGTTANILDNIAIYREQTIGQNDYSFQDTVQKQMNVYGYVVRGQRVGAGDGWLDTFGDHLTIQYRICHPSDKTKITGTKHVTNKYYFNVQVKDFYGVFQHEFNITQYRNTSYTVS